MPSMIHLSRRHFVAASPAVAVLPTLLTSSNAVYAQSAGTPEAEASPIGPASGATLIDQVLAMDPMALLEQLQTAPVETMLFPSDVGEVSAAAWEEDADLAGALGGVLLSGTGAPILGAFLVFEDAEAAEARLSTEQDNAPVPAAETTILGIAGATVLTMFGPITMLPVGTVLVWGYGVPPLDDVPTGPVDLEAEAVALLRPLELRSVSTAVGALDHLRMVVSERA